MKKPTLTMVRSLTQWTVADYHRMITAGLLCDRPVELLNGQIIDMAPELPIHRATYRRSSQYLASLLGERAVIFTTAPITLGSNSEPQPDFGPLLGARVAPARPVALAFHSVDALYS